jgi:cytosine/adenosine deaminase-related metal-dependent hydrolase
MRLAHLLHGGTGFRIDVGREAVLSMAFRDGRLSVTNRDEGGMLAPASPADILLLDWNAIDDDRLRPDLDPRDLLFARTSARHLRELIVAGRTVVRDGRVTGIDLDAMRAELLARLRAGMAGNASLQAALSDLESVLGRHFESEAPCC